MNYKHFKANIKGLTFEVKLIDDSATFPNSDTKDLVEEFKVIVTNGNKQIDYKFYNSIMERNLSQELQDLKNMPYTFSQKRKLLRSLKGWGGYDKVKTEKEMDLKRVYYLLYSIVQTFALDKETETSTFKDFCDNFGYDEDSRKAEKIFNSVLEFKRKVYDLRLSDEQEKYLNEEANQETDKFNQDIEKAVNNLEEI